MQVSNPGSKIKRSADFCEACGVPYGMDQETRENQEGQTKTKTRQSLCRKCLTLAKSGILEFETKDGNISKITVNSYTEIRIDRLEIPTIR